jgi:hypothetical protein
MSMKAGKDSVKFRSWSFAQSYDFTTCSLPSSSKALCHIQEYAKMSSTYEVVLKVLKFSIVGSA